MLALIVTALLAQDPVGCDIRNSTGSLTFNFPAIAPGTCSEATTPVGGAAPGVSACIVGVPPALGLLSTTTFDCYVSAANVVSVRACCIGVLACDPPSATFPVRVLLP